jgi:signal transduction histidine kinase
MGRWALLPTRRPTKGIRCICRYALVAFGTAPKGETPPFISSDAPAGTPVWRLSVAVALFGVLVTAVLGWRSWDTAQDTSTAALASQGEDLALSIEGAVHEATERLAAVGGLYQASGDVSQEQFLTFTNSLDPVPGMSGIGYIPIVPEDQLRQFEQQVAETIPGYYVFEVDADGQRVPVASRESYTPVMWFESRNIAYQPHGFDATSEPVRRSALIRARWDKEPAVTSFLTLLSDDDTDGFLVYWPILDTSTSETTGFAVAPMDLSDLLEGQIPTGLSDNVAWEIDTLMEGRRPAPAVDATWMTVIDVGSNWWVITVTRAEGQGAAPAPGLWVVVVGGLIATALVATVFHQYRTNRQAEEELDRLKDVTRAKDQFLASVSHELRTPLTGVLGFAELLRSDPEDLSENERRVMISSVAEEASDLAAIIDDLLVAARSELDLLAITSVPVSFRGQLAQVVEITDRSIRDRIEVVGDDRPVAMGDPGRVRQIIRNLLTNAARYGGDRIEVRLREGEDSVHLDVADNGDGLPDEEWERIFEPYYRVHKEGGTQPAALGIGLSVARHLARLMRGDLFYQREVGWSVFRLSLPVPPDGVRHPEQEASVSIIV